MKIKVIRKSYEDVLNIKRQRHSKPKKPNIFFRTLLKIVSLPDILKTRFKCEKIGMDKLGKHENALFLMNHSSFIDMEIVSTVLYPRPFNIVTTSDAFIGKNKLLRLIGCIPTNKFVSDTTLVRDMKIEIITKDGESESFIIKDNRRRVIRQAINENCVAIKITPLATYGKDEVRIFSLNIK